MASVCLYFQVHQPKRLNEITFFDIGSEKPYFNDALNQEILNKVADKCYLPANRTLLQLIKKHKGNFRVAFSLSGVLIEQLEQYRPDVLKSFKELADTGCVEFLGEAYYHSLSYFFSKVEFERQVKLHSDTIRYYFNQTPATFRGTELIYFNELAAWAENHGYKAILGEGLENYLMGRTPNILYKAPNVKTIKTLLRNYKLTDDIAFRFSNQNWAGYPLTADKYSSWVTENQGDTVNLFMDYETLGEHHWEDTGIFRFWEQLPEYLIKKGASFTTPSEAASQFSAKEIYDAHLPTSWADKEKDLSAWRGNVLQNAALKKLYELEKSIKQSGNQRLLRTWSEFQISDHFYYMSTKGEEDQAVHNYFSPFNSAYDAYLYYMNGIANLEIALYYIQQKQKGRRGPDNLAQKTNNGQNGYHHKKKEKQILNDATGNLSGNQEVSDN